MTLRDHIVVCDQKIAMGDFKILGTELNKYVLHEVKKARSSKEIKQLLIRVDCLSNCYCPRMPFWAILSYFIVGTFVYCTKSHLIFIKMEIIVFYSLLSWYKVENGGNVFLAFMGKTKLMDICWTNLVVNFSSFAVYILYYCNVYRWYKLQRWKVETSV